MEIQMDAPESVDAEEIIQTDEDPTTVRDAMLVMGPSMEGIVDQFTTAIIDLRSKGSTPALRGGLSNLQLFFTLLQKVIERVGDVPAGLATFDDGVNNCLAVLDNMLAGPHDAPTVADIIESHMLPALSHWPQCECELWRSYYASETNAQI